MFPNGENMITVPITKTMEIISKFVLFHKSTLIVREMVERKAFLANQSANIVYPNEENMIAVPNHKKNEDYYENLGLSYLMDEL